MQSSGPNSLFELQLHMSLANDAIVSYSSHCLVAVISVSRYVSDEVSPGYSEILIGRGAFHGC